MNWIGLMVVRDNAWLDRKANYEPIVIECALTDMTLHVDRQVHYRIHHRGFMIELFTYLRSDGRKLLISGQDAIQRQRDRLPYFYRWSWYNDIDVSFITFNDPTLYMADYLDAGWCQGFREIWAIDAIYEVLDRFAKLLKVESKDILLYGISAGGFWAMMSAILFPDCKVMVEIPQVDLFTYIDGGPKDRMFRRCFKGRSEDFIRKEYSNRLRVIDRWRTATALPSQVVYCQNIKDPRHTRTQMEPFWDEFNQLCDVDERFKDIKIDFRLFNRTTAKGGHVPMEKEQTISGWHELLSVRPQAVLA